MKIYTKKGDRGETSLYGGKRVSKSSCRIDTYGTVDELNSILGMVRSFEINEQVDQHLHHIQKQLFILGADLASPYEKEDSTTRITQEHITSIESAIDDLEEKLPELRNFILPGGSKPGSKLHFARTVCRRAERKCVKCKEEALFSEFTVAYLNRLSDYLFVAARFVNLQHGNREEKWQHPDNS